jgi:hypothetical protein
MAAQRGGPEIRRIGWRASMTVSLTEAVLHRDLDTSALNGFASIPGLEDDTSPSDRYLDMLELNKADLRRRALAELRAECLMSSDARREAARRRLTAWLELDPEEARVLARAYDEASAALDRESARSRLEAERDAILHGLRFDQFTRLVDLVPWLRSRLGLVMLGRASRASTSDVVAG